MVCSDVIAVAGAFFLSLLLHYDKLSLGQIFYSYIYQEAVPLLSLIVIYSLIFHAFRLYRYAWRFASLETLNSVIWSNTIGVLISVSVTRIFAMQPYPAAVFIVFWLLSIILIGGVRIMMRLASLGTNYGKAALKKISEDERPKRVIILSNGASSIAVLDALREELSGKYDVLGILDDTPGNKGKYIRNAQILGPLSHLPKLLDERDIDEVLIALQNPNGAEIREHVLECRKRKISVKIIPCIHEAIDGNGHKSTHFEDISVEDLLRRPTVRISLDRIGGCLTGANVMVTGAGGSIGSELCRQILALNPATLILLGHGENSIHNIHQTLCRACPGKINHLKMVIASVADETRMDQVFRAYKPQIVFHTAAHKHVPIMESNLIEAVQNNVIGTNCVAELCGRYGVEKMILVSSDKAVAPSSVMGATKWLCEEVARASAKVYPRTKYITVRFGNVLGSRGSVVPIFQEAIRNGGPVTVTDRAMTRYFMLIPEAAQLVLQAGTSGETGELFLLDMGEPVKIYDLACDMIRLSGLEPEKDIRIEFSTMRPGEKLHEALTGDDEQKQPAKCEGLFVVNRPDYFTISAMEDIISKIQEIIITGKIGDMNALLEELVPGFRTKGIIAKPIEPLESPKLEDSPTTAGT